MKYQYFYQTSSNENKSGFVNAKNRAEAYALLRKSGIRPYRLKGDDPLNWQPWAVGVAFAVLTTAFFLMLFFWKSEAVVKVDGVRRQQLYGDRGIISAGLETNWEKVLPTKLDAYLAAYAQPGWIALPPDCSAEEIAAFKTDLAHPLEISSSDCDVVRLLKAIVLAMRLEFAEYIANGGSPADYLKFLEERQDEEIVIRKRAIESVEASPEAVRSKVLMNANVRLREMGLAEIEQ